MKKIILSLLVMSFTLSSIAQDEKKATSSPKHHLGLHAGTTTGYGISYRYWPTKFGGEITASPRFETGGRYTVSTGLSFLYSLKENEKYTLFTYFGNSILAKKSNYQIYNQTTGIYTNEIKKTTDYNASIGFGVKVNFWENLNFNLQGGYGFYDITNDINTNFSAEIGMYYHF